MDRRNRYMESIDLRFRRQRNVFKKHLRQFTDFVGYEEFREGLNDLHSASCRARIPSRRLSRNKFRNDQIKVGPTSIPPFLRNLLIRGHHQIATSFCAEIAHDGCFDIYLGFHNANHRPLDCLVHQYR